VSTKTEPGYVFEGLVYQPGRRRLLDLDGREINLTSSELDVIQAFCENPQKTLTRQFLVSAVWHADKAPVGDRSVDVIVARVRKKIERDPQKPQIIKTVRHGGYWFTPASVMVSGDLD
jgi:two-component system OmpR family response regulator